MPNQFTLPAGASEVSIDKANIAMRAMPWYQNQMRVWGQDPGHPTLTKAQSAEITRLAQANGFIIDEGDIELDNHGNWNPKGHKLRNSLIVAGIAGATIATMGAAGAFSTAVLPSTTIGTGMTGTVAGGTGLAAGAETAAGLAGAAGTAGAVLPSTITAAGSAALPAGLASGTSAAGALGGTAGGGGILSQVGGLLKDKGGSFLGDALGAAGEATGRATSAAGNNRLNQEQLAIRANDSNISGQSEFERQMQARATAEDSQRLAARKDAYRSSVAASPTSSPFNTRPQVLTPQFLESMKNVGNAASGRLAAPQKYTVAGMPDVAPYVPLDIKNLQESTGTEKGTAESIGDWAGPISSILSQFLKARSAKGAA